MKYTTKPDKLQVYKNVHYKKRDYECTNIVACVSRSAPNSNYAPADDGILKNLVHIYTENNIKYFGYL